MTHRGRYGRIPGALGAIALCVVGLLAARVGAEAAGSDHDEQTGRDWG